MKYYSKIPRYHRVVNINLSGIPYKPHPTDVICIREDGLLELRVRSTGMRIKLRNRVRWMNYTLPKKGLREIHPEWSHVQPKTNA